MSAKALERAERLAHALELRKAGNTYDQIAKLAGYPTRVEAFRDLQKAFREYTLPNVEEIVKLQFGRYEQLLLAVYPAAITGNLDAVQTALKVLERLERLVGIDKGFAPAPAPAPQVTINVGELRSSNLSAMSERELAALYNQHVTQTIELEVEPESVDQ